MAKRKIEDYKAFVKSIRGLTEESKNIMVKEFLAGRDFSDAIEDAKMIGMLREREKIQGVK